MTSSNTQQHFLSVDDDDVFCSILSRALERREITTSTANSPQQAIELIQQMGNIFSHAVIDLNMGKESGLSLIPQLLNLDAQLKIVVLNHRNQLLLYNENQNMKKLIMVSRIYLDLQLKIVAV